MAPHMGGQKKRGHWRQWYTDPILQGSDHMYYNLPNFKRIFHLPGSIFSFRVNFPRVHCLPNKLLWISINWKRFLQTRTGWLVKSQLATDFPVVLGSSHIEPGASWVITVWKMMSGCIHGRRNPKEKLRFFWDLPSWAKASCAKRSTEKGGLFIRFFKKRHTKRVEKEPITLNQNHEKLIGTSHLRKKKKNTTTTSDGCLFGSHHHHHRRSWSHFRTEQLVQPCSIHVELVLETEEFVEAP